MDAQVSTGKTHQGHRNTYPGSQRAPFFQERADAAASSIALRRPGGEASSFPQTVDQISREGRTSNSQPASLCTPPRHWEGGDARGGLAPWQKRRLQAYIMNNLGDALYLKDLASEVSLSISHFCRAFKEGFGRTPHAYIIQCRMELAKRLMLTTEERLSHIALLCGLADQSHLTRLFRREIGSSPGNWRRRKLLMDPESSNRGGIVDYKQSGLLSQQD